MSRVPQLRISVLNSTPMRADADFVVYWMTAFRRPQANFALDRALEIAEELAKPVLVLEALRCDYAWASDRMHTFVLQGMADNQAAFAAAGVTYYPYVEPERHAGQGLLEALSEHAVAIVSDEYPCFFLPRMQRAAALRSRARLECVDSNGLLPLRAADRAFVRAYDFRRHVQRSIADHLGCFPHAEPLAEHRARAAARVPRLIERRWPRASAALLQAKPKSLAALPIDHTVGSATAQGGFRAAHATLERFVSHKLEQYAEARNQPDARGSSELSPYLHFGHLASHEIFSAIARAEDFSAEALGTRRRGQREGFWQVRPNAEAFLDQLVTWRELGYNFSHHRPEDYARYDALPEWALRTLKLHAVDPREVVYGRAELESASTYDELWNAAQRELSRNGTMHNYLRMLWGKKVLQWSASPEQALETLVELNNKYALDGRDPNSYSGIFWCFGRFDRAWGPERPVFGTIRYMSSESARRKLDLSQYLERWGP